jgi:hypothetical protein
MDISEFSPLAMLTEICMSNPSGEKRSTADTGSPITNRRESATLPEHGPAVATEASRR